MKDCKFRLGKRVTILAIETKAVIYAIMLSRGQTEYRVIYWFDGERRSEWLYEDELGG